MSQIKSKMEKKQVNLYFEDSLEVIRQVAKEEYHRVNDKALNDIEDLAQETALVILSLPRLCNGKDMISYAVRVACLNLNKE